MAMRPSYWWLYVRKASPHPRVANYVSLVTATSIITEFGNCTVAHLPDNGEAWISGWVDVPQ